MAFQFTGAPPSTARTLTNADALRSMLTRAGVSRPDAIRAVSDAIDSDRFGGRGNLAPDGAISLQDLKGVVADQVLSILGAVGFTAFIAPYRSSISVVDAASESITVTGSWRPGQTIKAFATYRGTSISSSYAVAIDGQSAWSGVPQAMKPAGRANSYEGSAVLDVGGQSMVITFATDLTAADTGQVTFEVFNPAE